ncbi:MAG: hypothetical protein KAX31_06040 [Thermoplasmata archaeon]|nr:hypothetical protein [Thermoplasmata archaeon]
MPKAMDIVLFGVCVNIALAIVAGSLGITGILISNSFTAPDPDKIVDTWNWGGTGSLVGDIGSGLKFLWNLVGIFVKGLFPLMRAMGCPSIIADPLEMLWYIIWISKIIEIITGRRILE